MLILLNLLSAISLLVWGTHIVRNGIMHIYGAHLRSIISRNINKKNMAFLSGILVTALVQSSNVTNLLVTSFVAQKIIQLEPALVVMLGADVGTAIMARILTFDLSWLSPLFILFGVIFFLSKKRMFIGQIGSISLGLGLILLSLDLIIKASYPITHSSGMQVIFSSLTGDLILDALIGALFSMISYSSLATVLIISTLTETGVISFQFAICLVVGANLGSGLIALIFNISSNIHVKRVSLGNFIFKLIGCFMVLPVLHLISNKFNDFSFGGDLVILFHILYNFLRCIIMIPITNIISIICSKIIVDKSEEYNLSKKPKYLDISALHIPSLALANAARETLRIGDILEQMIFLFKKILHGKIKDKLVRKLDDEIDILYTAIKLYLAQISKDGLSQVDLRRWAEIIEMTINLEQSGDIIERMSCDVFNKFSIKKSLFSSEGLIELESLQKQLLSNLHLGLSIFLSGNINGAQKLRRYKHRFRIKHKKYAYAHVDRLHKNNIQSLETSSLHLRLLGDMKRLNSLFCSVAYGILEKPQKIYY